MSKNSVDVGGDLKKNCPFEKYPLPSPPHCSIHNECSLSIALNNRYQVLEDGGLAVEEDELEIERDFQVMEKAYKDKKILSTRSERVKRQLRAKYTDKEREVKRSIKTDKKKWMENIADEAEEAAKSQQIKTLYGLTKMLCNERSRQMPTVLDKNGDLISVKVK